MPRSRFFGELPTCISVARLDISARFLVGVLAQLVERLVRNEKVRGSNPLGSTRAVLKNRTCKRGVFL
jgi:hypothetical protein